MKDKRGPKEAINSEDSKDKHEEIDSEEPDPFWDTTDHESGPDLINESPGADTSSLYEMIKDNWLSFLLYTLAILVVVYIVFQLLKPAPPPSDLPLEPTTTLSPDQPLDSATTSAPNQPLEPTPGTGTIPDPNDQNPKKLRPFNLGALDLEYKAKELLRDPNVAAVVYPRDINQQEIEAKVEAIEEEHRARGKYLLYFEREQLKEGIFKEMIEVINANQIEARINELIEFRQSAGEPPLDEPAKERKREEILAEIVEVIILGREGMKDFSATETEIKQGLSQYEAKFRDSSSFNQWIENNYGSLDQFKRWLQLKVAGDRYKQGLKAHITLHEDEVRSYYERNKQSFEEQERSKIAQIFLRISSTASETDRVAKRQLMQDILANLTSRGADFSQMAREYSEDGNGSRGGLIGFVKRGEFPAHIEEQIFGLSSNQVSPIIESRQGLHIFKVIQYYPHHIQPYEEVKEAIGAQLIENKFNESLSEHIKQLREQVEVKRKDSLSKYY